MTSPDPTGPDPTGPDPTGPDQTSPESRSASLPASSALPPAPWILLDRTTATQAAMVLGRLEQWLAGGGEPAAAQACAAICSLEEDDAFSVAAWLGALAARLEHRIEDADSWEADQWS